MIRRPRFSNPWATRPPPGHNSVLRWALAHRFTRPPDAPGRVVASIPPSFASPVALADELTVTWIGHSTTLVQIGGLNVLTDPVWAERASPVSFAGPRRRLPAAIELDELPPIDAVVISHDHYDHLDLATVRRLAAMRADTRWLVPLGLGNHLRGVGVGRIDELA